MTSAPISTASATSLIRSPAWVPTMPPPRMRCDSASVSYTHLNTLLNYAGVKPDLLPLVCDAAPYKQGKYLPGSRIPIHAPEKLKESRPDYVVVFPWNIIEEVMQQNQHVRDWGGKFVTAVPTLEIR